MPLGIYDFHNRKYMYNSQYNERRTGVIRWYCSYYYCFQKRDLCWKYIGLDLVDSSWSVLECTHWRPRIIRYTLWLYNNLTPRITILDWMWIRWLRYGWVVMFSYVARSSSLRSTTTNAINIYSKFWCKYSRSTTTTSCASKSFRGIYVFRVCVIAYVGCVCVLCVMYLLAIGDQGPHSMVVIVKILVWWCSFKNRQ